MSKRQRQRQLILLSLAVLPAATLLHVIQDTQEPGYSLPELNAHVDELPVHKVSQKVEIFSALIAAATSVSFHVHSMA
jgi:hypothetical protein